MHFGPELWYCLGKVRSAIFICELCITNKKGFNFKPTQYKSSLTRDQHISAEWHKNLEHIHFYMYGNGLIFTKKRPIDSCVVRPCAKRMSDDKLCLRANTIQEGGIVRSCTRKPEFLPFVRSMTFFLFGWLSGGLKDTFPKYFPSSIQKGRIMKVLVV